MRSGVQTSFGLRSLRRASVVVWPVVLGTLILGACGSDAEGGATASTIDLKPTEYITKEPVPTTIAPIVAAQDTSGEQLYTIQAGDFPIKVANLFGVPLEDLLNYNGLSQGEFPFPGETIKIPPGGTPAAEAAATQTAAAATDTATETAAEAPAEPVGDTIPVVGSNCEPGKYVLVDGDNPSKVATAFDVTVPALQAANANTAGFSSFIVGTEIVIPAKADC